MGWRIFASNCLANDLATVQDYDFAWEPRATEAAQSSQAHGPISAEDEYHPRRARRPHFWPTFLAAEIWSKYVDDEFDNLFKLEYRQRALDCSSEIILNALGHVEDWLIYLSYLTEQSVFNFCAIPQAMAIATLELCFANPALFERNVKITKGEACRLMLQSTRDIQGVSAVFRVYVRKIHGKCSPTDKHFIGIRAACDKIEKFIETTFAPNEADDAAASANNSSQLKPLLIEKAPSGNPSLEAGYRTEGRWVRAKDLRFIPLIDHAIPQFQLAGDKVCIGAYLPGFFFLGLARACCDLAPPVLV
ncbi:isoprenoid synthase domain-containing protein [Aspergillus cavernicola]|uniref:Isoprenoid synthase domain-containing protein n=1 Tax=Aspergillus cavernicola TaxID=176166 RepID=A0ABR4INV0_9EURO